MSHQITNTMNNHFRKMNSTCLKVCIHIACFTISILLCFTVIKTHTSSEKPIKYSFVHIPKTGGTALSYWIEQQQKDNLCTEIIPFKNHNLNTNHAIKMHTHPITIIRHPIDRFTSSFYYWKKGSKDIQMWKRNEKWEIANAVKTPDDLISILKNHQHPLHKKIKYKITHKDQYTDINHFTPQNRWIKPNTNPTIICYDEKNLPSNIQKAFDHLETNCPVGAMPLINTTIKPKQQTQLNQESLIWLREIYKDDFYLWQKYCTKKTSK